MVNAYVIRAIELRVLQLKKLLSVKTWPLGEGKLDSWKREIGYLEDWLKLQALKNLS